MDKAARGVGDDPLIGRQLANFRIEKIIKRGGMAQVYYGRDVMLERPVAIKVIDARYRDRPAYAERFLREARAVAAWSHEHIIKIYYAGKEGELYYFAMEYINGLDLKELLARYAIENKLIPHADVLRIGKAVAAALDYAHRHGVIHRDVKPSNVMISAGGRVLLMDFGLAMAVEEGSRGETFGTPHYIAPEQALRSADAVPQSDLYSLAVMLYEMLVGKVPFDDPSAASLALQHISLPPPRPRSLNPQLSAEVEQVLLKGLHKKSQNRYQTGAEMMADLERALQVGERVTGGRIVLPPVPPGLSVEEMARSLSSLSQLSVVEKIALELKMERPPRPAAPVKKRKSPLAWWGGIGALVVVLGFIVFLLFSSPLLRRGGGEVLQQSVGSTATEEVGAILVATATETATMMPTTTPAPTETAVATTTSTPIPSPTPTATLSPTPAPAASVTPSLSGFAGPPLRFLYNRYSFYVYNPGPDGVAVTSLAFEALDASGEPAGYVFQGRDWTQFFPRIEARHCVAITPVNAPSLLEPAECQGYNATVSPTLQDKSVFWTPRNGVRAFRVFWNGQEIGRCPIVAGTCELSLPE